MELNVSKHSHDDISLSTDVFRFLQQDHNLLSEHGKKKCFYCEMCTKGFSEENDLHYHRLDHITDKPLFICDDPAEELVSEKLTSPKDNEVCQEDIKLFPCERCHRCYSTMSCLRIHQKYFHFEYVPTSSCNGCGSHFKWKHHLAVHKYPNANEKISLCNTCNINPTVESCTSDKCNGESSIKKDHLGILDLSQTCHKPGASIGENLMCHYCGKEFSLKDDLSRHLLVHTGVNSFASKYWVNKISRKARQNTEAHAKKTPFICSICQKSYTHAGFLKRHLQHHSEGKSFVCHICHTLFSDDGTFKQHLTTHADEEPFVCNFCFKSFIFQSDFDSHLQIHCDGKDKPYPCDFCEGRFIRKRCLITHIMRLHSDQRPA